MLGFYREINTRAGFFFYFWDFPLGKFFLISGFFPGFDNPGLWTHWLQKRKSPSVFCMAVSGLVSIPVLQFAVCDGISNGFYLIRKIKVKKQFHFNLVNNKI